MKTPFVNDAQNTTQTDTTKDLCVTGDTELLTTNGYTTVKELFEQKQQLNVLIDRRIVSTNENVSKPVNSNMIQVTAKPIELTATQSEIYRVTTTEGFTIRATSWHKFFVKRNRQIKKIALSELKANDQLLIQSDVGAFGDNDNIQLGYLLGIITSNGTLIQRGNDDYLVNITLFDDAISQANRIQTYINDIIEKFLPDQQNEIAEFTNIKNNTALNIKSPQLATILQNETNYNFDERQQIPKYIKRANDATQIAYLSAIYQTKMTIKQSMNKLAINLETNSIQQAKGLQLLLINLGIYSEIKKYNIHNSLKYYLTTDDTYAIAKLHETLKLNAIDQRKINVFLQDHPQTDELSNNDFTARVASVNLDGIEDVYDTTQEQYHALTFNGIVTGNCSQIEYNKKVRKVSLKNTND